MDKTKRFFLCFLIAIGFLFVVACFSIIFVFVYNYENTADNLIPIVYLFFYLIAISFIFYTAFRAFISKPSIMSVMMIDEHGIVIKKSKIVTLVLAIFSGLLFAFSLALVCGLDMTIVVFSRGAEFALVNTSLAFSIISLFFHFYPKFHKNIKEK